MIVSLRHEKISRTCRYMNKLVSYQDKDIIKFVTGLCRSGKSTLLVLFQNRLLAKGVMPSQIQFYNFVPPSSIHSPILQRTYPHFLLKKSSEMLGVF